VEAKVDPRIDVVIVHYPSAADLIRCLETLASYQEQIASVTVVDNAAPDGVPTAISSILEVAVIREPENLGFARAANRGATAGEAQHLLFLNPDVRLTHQTLELLVSALDGDRVAAAAPRLLLPDGQPQVGAAGCFPTVSTLAAHALQVPAWVPGQWSKKPMFLAEPNGSGNGSRKVRLAPQPVEWVSAACLLIRRDAFEQVGGFDERFFMYAEDIDLCLRLHERGWQVRYCPTAQVEHCHLSTKQPKIARAPADAWIKGLDQFYRLHCPERRRLLHFVFGVGFAMRAVAYGSRIAAPRASGSRAYLRLARYARSSFSLALAP
jgi:N-acetylglucosaminyl-diphospho-decaprenol L-rhamnosyltransferase